MPLVIGKTGLIRFDGLNPLLILKGGAQASGVTYMTLPPPIGASPYADAAAANAILTAQTSNRRGFIDYTGFVAFSASFSAGALTVDITCDSTGIGGSAWFGFNGKSGQILSVAYSGTGGFAQIYYAELYNSAGTLLQTVSSTSMSSPLTFTGLSSAGLYEVRLNASALLFPFETLVATFVATASGGLDASLIRAAYGSTPSYAY